MTNLATNELWRCSTMSTATSRNSTLLRCTISRSFRGNGWPQAHKKIATDCWPWYQYPGAMGTGTWTGRLATHRQNQGRRAGFTRRRSCGGISPRKWRYACNGRGWWLRLGPRRSDDWAVPWPRGVMSGVLIPDLCLYRIPPVSHSSMCPIWHSRAQQFRSPLPDFLFFRIFLREQSSVVLFNTFVHCLCSFCVFTMYTRVENSCCISQNVWREACTLLCLTNIHNGGQEWYRYVSVLDVQRGRRGRQDHDCGKPGGGPLTGRPQAAGGSTGPAGRRPVATVRNRSGPHWVGWQHRPAHDPTAEGRIRRSNPDGRGGRYYPGT